MLKSIVVAEKEDLERRILSRFAEVKREIENSEPAITKRTGGLRRDHVQHLKNAVDELHDLVKELVLRREFLEHVEKEEERSKS